MHGRWRIVGLVLLIATAAALPGAVAMPSAVAPARKPAGCHGHAPAIPSPAPVSYQCCVSGHQAALPNVAFSHRYDAAVLYHLKSCVSLGSNIIPDALPVVFVVPSDSPPITGSLRI